MKALPEDILLEVAIKAAQRAGSHAWSNRQRCNEIACRYAHDVKLKLDQECQAEAEAAIKESFPAHRILGEERRDSGDSEEPLWIIDPIDGTVNFQHGLPLWCSSVAVQVDGEVVAGAVFAPDMEELYTATLSTPALCNGTPIRVSRNPRLADALLLTGLSKHVEEHPDAFNALRDLSLRAQKVRIMGAAAVDICHVAAGKADGYYESVIYLWDIAAAGLIARRAGASTEALADLGDLRYRFLCTNGLIHTELKSLLATNAYERRPPARL